MRGSLLVQNKTLFIIFVLFAAENFNTEPTVKSLLSSSILLMTSIHLICEFIGPLQQNQILFLR